MADLTSELEKKIVDSIGARDDLEVNDIARALDMESAEEFKQLVKAIAKLERRQEIILTSKGTFIINQQKIDEEIQGRFKANDKGFGFVILEDSDQEDIFIPANATNTAFDGDQVQVEIIKAPDPRKDKAAEGKITKILERKTESVIGEFYPYSDEEVKDLDLYGYVKPSVKGYPDLTIQIQTKGLRPVQGEIVKVDITRYPHYTHEDTVGLVTETIGHKDEPGVDILSIVHKHGIPSEFPEEVLDQAQEVPDQISPEDLKGRKDLRQETIITIDGADAKDLDDAIQVKRLNNGHYHLGVHIADVAHYVQEGTAIDQEAYERGTSSYLTDRVIPMLPQRLSNGICSLHPGVDRLTLSCQMEIDQAGEVVQYDIGPSVIQSSQRMTYRDVNAILDEDDQAKKDEFADLVPMFEDMADLHHILENKRKKRGAIDFESTEAQIEVDDQGQPTDIKLLERGTGEKLIESFMLAANETVSEHYTKQHLPILYRVHEQPDEAKIQRFLEFIATLGITVKASKDSISPKDLQKVLAKVEGQPTQVVVNMLLLRSMQQARYDVDPLGHYGLGAEFYSHFTSPIRRYPDLILHRLIHYYDEVGRSKKDVKRWEEKLPEIAEASSFAERRAIDAERETDELKKVEYMADKIGQEFKGMIVSITGFGMFIQLPNTVEGLVHISLLDDDFYEFNDEHLVLVGQRTGNIYRIGQEIAVKLIRADTQSIQIDFDLVRDNKGQNHGQDKKAKHKKKAHKHKGKKGKHAKGKGKNNHPDHGSGKGNDKKNQQGHTAGKGKKKNKKKKHKNKKDKKHKHPFKIREKK